MYAFVDLKGRRVELERQGDSSQKGVSQYPLTYINWEQNDLMPDGGGVEYGFDTQRRLSKHQYSVRNVDKRKMTKTRVAIRVRTRTNRGGFESRSMKRAGSLLSSSLRSSNPSNLETPSKSEKLEDLTNPREAGLRELGMYEAALARRRDVLETGLQGVRSSGSAWAPSTAARCLCPGLGMEEVFVRVRVGVEFLESSSSLHVFLRLELELVDLRIRLEHPVRNLIPLVKNPGFEHAARHCHLDSCTDTMTMMNDESTFFKQIHEPQLEFIVIATSNLLSGQSHKEWFRTRSLYIGNTKFFLASPLGRMDHYAEKPVGKNVCSGREGSMSLSRNFVSGHYKKVESSMRPGGCANDRLKVVRFDHWN
ncbi:hypothetical protein EV360DRAFT_75288 [Lentinula raphanica]|nr:hypothetical protein EV360DRAFT_75288 [Lentinula raphanica]